MSSWDLLERYKKVVLLNRTREGWNQQQKYGGKFPYPKRRLTDADLEAMLRHEHWLASRAPQEGLTDRIAFDLDCDGEGEQVDRDERYGQIRRLFGMEHVPLVYGTPSGWGLRVVYRIPIMPLEELITGPRSGLVADVLCGAGLYPRSGFLEIFPQKSYADRLMLGRRMPLLDPVRLKPLSHAAIGDTFDEHLLRQALGEVESWHAQPCVGLVEHLRGLPRQADVTLVPQRKAGRSESTIRVSGESRQPEPPHSLRRLIKHGLERPRSRFASEWIVGLAFITAPERYPAYDLPEHPTHEEVAHALTLWLSRKHNGHSREWTCSLARCGSEAAAIQEWTRRYLLPSATTGDHLIDRLMWAAGNPHPLGRRILQLTAHERDALLQLAEKHFVAGAARYRFECWLFAWQRAVKRILRHHSPAAQSLEVSAGPGSGPAIEIELCAQWMQAWPYGNGRSQPGGEASYLRYRQILREERLMVWAAPYISPTLCSSSAAGEIRGQATRYRVRHPQMRASLRDVPVAPETLTPAIVGITAAYNRQLSIDEAYHALHVIERGFCLRARYGRKTAALVSRIATDIQGSLAGSGPAEFPLAA